MKGEGEGKQKQGRALNGSQAERKGGTKDNKSVQQQTVPDAKWGDQGEGWLERVEKQHSTGAWSSEGAIKRSLLLGKNQRDQSTSCKGG